MRYQMNFGSLKTDSRERASFSGTPFRIAILGDFSGRANAGKLEIGDALAGRKAIKIDVDNLDEILERFAPDLNLPVSGSGGSVEIKPRSIDDLHPDELYSNVELFEEMSSLRMQVENSSMFDRAAEAIAGWVSEGTAEKIKRRKSRPRGSAVPVDGKLDDFARLVGTPATQSEATPADELIKQMVAPYVVAAADPDQDMMLAALDEALSGAMRSILHNPDFQALESAWRTLDMLVRRVETSHNLQLVVYDISAEEFAADLSSQEDLADTGLFKLLVEQPLLDEQQGAFSLMVGCYGFEQTPPHAELLARVARLAAAAEAPFISSIGNDCITAKLDDLHPLVTQAWDGLRGMPECAFLSLTVPRFMLRAPYGAKSEPIDSFKFEEFNDQVGLRAFLWGNSAVLAAILLAETYNRMGERMMLGKIMSLGDMPFHFYTDSDGDQIALPSTERMLTERTVAHVSGQRFAPVLSIRGRPEVRLGSFQSVAGGELMGRWTPNAHRDAIMGAIAAKNASVPESGPESGPEPETEPEAAPVPVPVAAEPPPPAPEPESAGAAADAELEPDPEPTEEAADNGLGDLDDLLADLGVDDADSEGDDDADDSGDDALDDLDALLADLGGNDEEEDNGEMDPDLAALLDSL